MSPLFRPLRLTFADATGVQVVSLRQSLVYQGLLEGLPTREMNQRIVERIRQENPSAIFVTPSDRPLDIERPYPLGTPSALPDVRCEARLDRNEGLDGYAAELCWFQDTWAPPLDDAVLAFLRQTSWFEVATRYEL